MAYRNIGNEMYDFAMAVVEGKVNIPDHALVIHDIKTAAKLITKKQSELLKLLKGFNPATEKELAQHVKRRKQAVTRDLKKLEGLGIVRLERNGRSVKPHLEKKLIVVAIA